MVNLDTSAKLTLDPQGLEQLRAQARKSPDQALKAAAQQLESVFLNMMLKSMREATPQEGMFDNEQTRMFTGMLDQQLAQEMASRGVGLADTMIKQLSHNMGGPPSDPGIHMLLSPADATGKPVWGVPSAYNLGTQQDFVNRMLPYATEASRVSGVPTQLILGQAALESGWGKHEITMADGSRSYNLFGIKANADWNGKVAEVMTTEYKNGVAYKQVEKFRAYSSYAEAFGDHARLLSTNPRYAQVMQPGLDGATAAQAVQRAGYATDPDYAEKITKIISIINELS